VILKHKETAARMYYIYIYIIYGGISIMGIAEGQKPSDSATERYTLNSTFRLINISLYGILSATFYTVEFASVPIYY
jgi:hypothetical protein